MVAGLLLARPVSSAVAATEYGRPLVQYFSPRAYQGTQPNWAGAQSATGPMYFANTGSLLVNDGAAWRHFQVTPDGLNLRGLAFGPDGRLYLGGINIFGYLRPGTEDYVSLVEKLPEAERRVGQITQIVVQGDTVCFVAEKTIFLWRDERFTQVPCAGGRLHAVGDTLYVTALNQPLRRLAAGRLGTVADAPVVRENDIRFMGAGADGTVLLGTAKDGLWKFFPAEGGRFAPFATEVDRLPIACSLWFGSFVFAKISKCYQYTS